MCGITGMVNLKKKVDIQVFEKMNNIIKHRGPDDEGYTFINSKEIVKAYGDDSADFYKNKYENINNIKNEYTVALGHRRLSILDLSPKGHQPMSDETENIHITFNGEIYNYIELKEELKKKGYKFSTNCDTEVIIKSYQEWGEECVNKFNGMWAFIIYDKQKSQLFCSRDRFGVKPFYYYQKEDKIIFASEVKQILEDPTVERIANDSVIYNYIFYGRMDYNENTFFKNIYSLPGSFNMKIYLDLDKNCISVEKYRYYDLECKGLDKSEKEAIQLFKKEFQRSIKYRLRSDIPVGSCLSGGLDSSSVVTEACNNLKKDGKNKEFQTFTSCYDEDSKIDERYFSKKVVEKSGCKENLIFPKKEGFINEIEKVMWHQDFPFPSLSIYAQWSVMKGVKEKNVKVLLDGQGADETLLGYERYAIFLLKDNFRHLKFKEFFRNYRLLKEKWNFSFKRFVAYFVYFSNNYFCKYIVKKLCNPVINKKFLKEHRKNKDYANNLDFKDGFSLNRTEVYYSNLPPLLRYEDRNSMAFSIETRVPFLDYKLVEEGINIPIDLKIKDGWTKYILRKAMENEMDDEVVYRKNKLGFAAPQKSWLDKLDDEYVKKYLKNMKTQKYFDEEKIKKIFREKTDDEMRWRFLSLEIWLELFNVTIEK